MTRLYDTHVAIITGASRGIGRAIAVEFARNGWATAICARNYQQLLETQKLCLAENPVPCVVARHDVRDPIAPFVDKAVGDFGRLDVLINNAGMIIHKPFSETSMREFREVVETNLIAQVEITSAVLPQMLGQRRGVIVNIVSSAGKFGFPKLTAYSASKHGLVGFTKALSAEMKGTGVKVVGICPARVDTQMHQQTFPEAYRSLLRYTILKPETVAKRVVQVVTSNETRNGQIVDIDPWHTNLYHQLRSLLVH